MILFSAIQFSSLAMLGWLAAALLPWLIHRLVRSRHQTTRWAAVEILLTALQQQARRIHFQQWLLLLVRTAIIALVALAVAEPSWQVWSLGVGNSGQGHLILVLDQSYSMSCQQENQSRFDRAKQQAKQLLNQGSKITSVIGWSQASQNVIGRPTSDASQARVAIESLEQSQAKADLASAVQAATAAIDRAQQEWPQIQQHQVVFISDQTHTTWTAEEIKKTDLSALSERASLSVINVSDDQRDNLAVVDISLDVQRILRQQEFLVTAKLHCYGSKAWNEVAVELNVDGQLIETQTVNLPASGEQSVTFAHQFIDEGHHTINVTVTGNKDALPLDNRRWLVVDVQPKLQIACIAGAPKSADDVARALAPHQTSAEHDPTIQAKIFPVGQLLELDLSQYDTLFLCDVKILSSDELTRLANYVQSGGGLAILVGEQTDINGELAKLLPVEINTAVTLGDYRFDPREYAHSIISPFRGQASSGLSNVAIAKYRRLAVKNDRESVETVLAFDSSDPALVVEKSGAGRIAVLAIPASLTTQNADQIPWSSFPVSPSFLPTIRELVQFLAGDANFVQQNRLVGQHATCQWDTARRPVPIDVRGPDDFHAVLPMQGSEDAGLVVFSDTSRCGIYKLSTEGEEFAQIAVNLDPRESNLSTLEPDTLPVEFVASVATAEKSFRLVSTSGQSWVRILLAGAILLFLAESFLACWQGRTWQ